MLLIFLCIPQTGKLELSKLQGYKISNLVLMSKLPCRFIQSYFEQFEVQLSSLMKKVRKYPAK